MDECKCRLCDRARRIEAAVASRDVDALIVLVKELANENVNIGADLDYHQCILNGSWPAAQQILSIIRGLRRESVVGS